MRNPGNTRASFDQRLRGNPALSLSRSNERKAAAVGPMLLAKHGARIGIDVQWQAMDGPLCKLRQILKNQHLKGLAAIRQTVDTVGTNFIRMWMITVFLWEWLRREPIILFSADAISLQNLSLREP